MNGKHFEPRGKNRATSGLEPLSLTVHQVLGDTRAPLQAEFSYDPADPLFVTLVFRPAGEPAVTWQISRDLLVDGLSQPSGIGDVRIRPTRYGALVRVRLQEHGATAQFDVGLPELQEWLTRTCALVPIGEELRGVDWDAVTRELLGGL
jgi:hypothetical protein